MTADKWADTRDKIKSTFTILDEYEEDLDPGVSDVLEFEGPAGKLRARFLTRPKVTGKKTLYSNRIGGDTRVDYEFSENEEVCHLEVSRWNESTNDWEELRGSSLF